MGLITIKDHIKYCSSNQDGKIIRDLITEEFKKDQVVTISFEGIIGGVTSSFINSALIDLLNNYDFTFVKQHLKFSNTTKQINQLIKSRFDFEVNHRKKIETSNSQMILSSC